MATTIRLIHLCLTAILVHILATRIIINSIVITPFRSVFAPKLDLKPDPATASTRSSTLMTHRSQKRKFIEVFFVAKAKKRFAYHGLKAAAIQ